MCASVHERTSSGTLDAAVLLGSLKSPELDHVVGRGGVSTAFGLVLTHTSNELYYTPYWTFGRASMKCLLKP
jgi:hypothetical protein